MRVLFVYSRQDIAYGGKPLRSPDMIQFGISYISAFLRRHSHQTSLLVLGRPLGRGNWLAVDRRLAGFRPELVCFTAVATEFPFVANVARYMRAKRPDLFLLIGGPHASLCPEQVIADCFDAVCIGEGELPTLELISQLGRGCQPSGIRNLWIKHDGQIERSPARPFMQDLDSLPFPDREMWGEWIANEASSRFSVLLGRGCPFQCTYCCNDALRGLASGQYVRFRSPQSIVQEIEGLVQRFPTMREVYLEVESITIRKDWAFELCSQLASLNEKLSKPVAFGANLRIVPNMHLRELLAAFRKAGFRFVHIGLESGSERIRREVLNRRYSNEDVVKAVQLARMNGLKVALYNMIGLPGETIRDFMETVRINRVCQPDWHFTSIFYPYPGTELHQLCEAEGSLNQKADDSVERREPVLDLPDFKPRQVQRCYVWFDYYVYRGKRPLRWILCQVLRRKLASSARLNSLYRLATRWRPLLWLKQRLALSNS